MSSSSPPRRFAGLPRTTVGGLEVPLATGFRTRLLGLAHLDREEAGAGLVIPRCRSVHTFGMRFALDLIFLDEDLSPVEIREGVPPRRVARARQAAMVLELPATSVKRRASRA